MVEVFKTNIAEGQQHEHILTVLTERFPGFTINFDLEDCDRILRVEAKKLNPSQIVECLQHNGYWCEVLD